MKILITICARGGSKGIPGKNIRPLNGQPLIAYSIAAAKNFAEKYPADIAISTDDAEILEVAARYGVTSDYLRPDFLATDTAGKIDTIKDIVIYQERANGYAYDFILDLDVTSPLRTIEDLVGAFKTLLADDNAENIFSVNAASRNPYFNMVEQKENSYYHTVKSGAGFLSRQTAPKVFELNASFYFYRRRFFEESYRTVFTDRSLIFELPHICFDLDHMIDFEFLDYLLSNNKLDFQI